MADYDTIDRFVDELRATAWVPASLIDTMTLPVRCSTSAMLHLPTANHDTPYTAQQRSLGDIVAARHCHRCFGKNFQAQFLPRVFRSARQNQWQVVAELQRLVDKVAELQRLVDESAQAPTPADAAQALGQAYNFEMRNRKSVQYATLRFPLLRPASDEWHRLACRCVDLTGGSDQEALLALVGPKMTGGGKARWVDDTEVVVAVATSAENWWTGSDAALASLVAAVTSVGPAADSMVMVVPRYVADFLARCVNFTLSGSQFVTCPLDQTMTSQVLETAAGLWEPHTDGELADFHVALDVARQVLADPPGARCAPGGL